MWEFNPEGPRAIQHFLGMTHEEMYKSFFGPQIECPDIVLAMGSPARTARPGPKKSDPARPNAAPGPGSGLDFEPEGRAGPGPIVFAFS